jgi:hypothetical protein
MMSVSRRALFKGRIPAAYRHVAVDRRRPRSRRGVRHSPAWLRTQHRIGRLGGAGERNRRQGLLEVAKEQPGGFGHGVIDRRVRRLLVGVAGRPGGMRPFGDASSRIAQRGPTQLAKPAFYWQGISQLGRMPHARHLDGGCLTFRGMCGRGRIAHTSSAIAVSAKQPIRADEPTKSERTNIRRFRGLGFTTISRSVKIRRPAAAALSLGVGGCIL